MKSNAGNCSGLLSALLLATCAFALLFAVPPGSAQTASTETKPTEAAPPPEAYQTFYLSNVMQPTDANDVSTVLRNMIPRAHIFYVNSQNAISVRARAEDLQLAQKVISDVDHARKAYRLTYSIHEMENGKSVGTRHVSLVVLSGGKTVVKQGSRVPIVTGMYDSDSAKANTEVQYVDVGLNIEASLEASPEGVRLKTRIEQSSVADEKASSLPQDPVIRQTSLEGVSSLVSGKPLALGSMDVPGSARQEEIEVVAEPVS